MTDEYDHDFFFSYAGADRARVDLVAELLKDDGFRVWAYSAEVYAETTKAINDAIRRSRDFVLWVSAAHLASGYCVREIAACLHESAKSLNTRRVFIVVLDDEGNQFVSKQSQLNADDAKYRGWLKLAKVNPEHHAALVTWLTERAAVGREPRDTAPIPVAVLAMTKAEADSLPGQLSGDRIACYEEWKKSLEGVDSSCVYGESRDDWKPLTWPEDAGGVAGRRDERCRKPDPRAGTDPHVLPRRRRP